MGGGAVFGDHEQRVFIVLVADARSHGHVLGDAVDAYSIRAALRGRTPLFN
jgi:hypothetical protein